MADCGSLESVAGQRWHRLDPGFSDAVVVGTKKVGMKGKRVTPPIWAIVLTGARGCRDERGVNVKIVNGCEITVTLRPTIPNRLCEG